MPVNLTLYSCQGYTPVALSLRPFWLFDNAVPVATDWRCITRQTSGGVVSWYLADALETVHDLINNSGAIIDHISISASSGRRVDESSPTSGDQDDGCRAVGTRHQSPL